jgi:hypothetical protein
MISPLRMWTFFKTRYIPTQTTPNQRSPSSTLSLIHSHPQTGSPCRVRKRENKERKGEISRATFVLILTIYILWQAKPAPARFPGWEDKLIRLSLFTSFPKPLMWKPSAGHGVIMWQRSEGGGGGCGQIWYHFSSRPGEATAGSQQSAKLIS